jgi:hypothetical protein
VRDGRLRAVRGLALRDRPRRPGELQVRGEVREDLALCVRLGRSHLRERVCAEARVVLQQSDHHDFARRRLRYVYLQFKYTLLI